ncbi:GGDEF domain-containing protein [Rhodoferax sp.]|uniref:GGDEF domain-containing protein n=1 Tax=Rhodoferax sp. TaxID=50421 RepID=UPI0025D7F27F|nr:GGDEF domain-containing protein [Rhodoferax sp.]
MQAFDFWISRLNRLRDALLGTDRPMRIRTSQAALASVLMFASMADLYLLAWHGLADIRHVVLWSVFCTLGLVLVFGLIRSGFSLRWSDPSLAFGQMLYAIACNAVAFVLAGHGRGISLALMAVILMFGMFGMSMRQVVMVALYAMLLFGVAMLVAMEQALTDEPAVLYAAYFFMLLIVLTSSTILTRRLGLMRAHTRKQKVQLALALKKIQLIATRDELTGTANRRFMLELMREEIQRADRSGATLMVAILDIDYFKRVNDSYGHQAGDRCLQAFARVVQSSIRTTDRLARWGGEEFLILLGDTNFALALACLERVRAQVEQAVVAMGEIEIRITVSIGVTQYQTGDSIEQTIDRADLALYAAKAQGRNQVVSV